MHKKYDIMEDLLLVYHAKLRNTSLDFVRSLMGKVNWEARMIGIRGARGTGKTTLLMQRLKMQQYAPGIALYVSLDNIYFSDHKIYYLARDFVRRGGRYLYIDEVHKYQNWSQELKNIYDDFPELHIAFTASSLLSLKDGNADLSRRALMYELSGLSFREYIKMSLKVDLPIVTMEDVLTNTHAVCELVLGQIQPLQYFKEYLQYGYYPFFTEGKQDYYQRIAEVVNYILEAELPQLRKIDVSMTPKIKQLMYILSQSVPFVPNISKLSERIGVTRVTLLHYLNALHESKLVLAMSKPAMGISVLQKPEKLYLENTNLMYALAGLQTDIGNVRETFFANQLKVTNKINVSPKSDFIVNDEYTFEIGGKKKGFSQIEGMEQSYVVADDIEYGVDNKIPLWMFGLMY